MKVLIIEDTAAKADAIEREVRANVASDNLVAVQRADSLSAAISAFEKQEFDLIVLDLMVPFIPRGAADRSAGLELLRHIRSAGCNSRKALVIGMSAFPDEVKQARSEFDRLAVAIVEFSEKSGWQTALQMACTDAAKLSRSNYRVDFVILVALEEEKEGYRGTALTLGSKAIIGGLNVQFARLTGKVEASGVIIQHRRMGLIAATLDASSAIRSFKPTVLAMSGICAGFSEQVKLGSLVISSPSWEYQAGKWSNNGFLIEPYQVSIRPKTKTICDQLFDDNNYMSALETKVSWSGGRPTSLDKARVAPGVTGSAVIADSERLKHIPAQHRKVSVLDMETYGIYAACFESDWFVPHFFSLKAVVDLADQDKADDLHSYGAAMSAAATIDLIEEILADPSTRGG